MRELAALKKLEKSFLPKRLKMPRILVAATKSGPSEKVVLIGSLLTGAFWSDLDATVLMPACPFVAMNEMNEIEELRVSVLVAGRLSLTCAAGGKLKQPQNELQLPASASSNASSKLDSDSWPLATLMMLAGNGGDPSLHCTS